MMTEEIKELASALAKAQGEMKNATMNRTNPYFNSKYADYSSVREAIQKPLADNGLSYVHSIECRPNGAVLVTRLIHTSGQFIASEYPLPMQGKPQEMGSILSYARRYSLSGLVGVGADDDDDANAAEDKGQKIETKAKGKPAKPEPKPDPSGDLSDRALDMIDGMDAQPTLINLKEFGQAIAADVNSLKDNEQKIVRGHFKARQEALKMAENLAA